MGTLAAGLIEEKSFAAPDVCSCKVFCFTPSNQSKRTKSLCVEKERNDNTEQRKTVEWYQQYGDIGLAAIFPEFSFLRQARRGFLQLRLFPSSPLHDETTNVS
jgi:hypothetical protein